MLSRPKLAQLHSTLFWILLAVAQSSVYFIARCKCAQRLQFWLIMEAEKALHGLHKRSCTPIQRPENKEYPMIVVKMLFML